jgi:Rrf2 family nitric oxide-sensitive transcriptional repressor
MEADFAIVECFPGGGGGCLITPGCRLKGVLREALEAFLSVLDRSTLADLTRKNALLQDLLREAA